MRHYWQPVSETPDGLENLVRHNLITYKSTRQPLDAWALDELLGHFVNYRKQISPALDELLPLEDFGLYAISTRYPQKLAAEVELQPIKEGVYAFRWGGRKMRLIVLSEVAQVARNVLWLMFSGIAEKVQYAFSKLLAQQQELPPLLNKLVNAYHVEGIPMAITVEDVKRELRQEYLALYTPEERLKGLSQKQITAYLKKLSATKRTRKRGA